MKRPVVLIDEEKCDGCGLCVPSCAEGAIQIIEGKARLVDDRFCDGLGACLGECPQGALTVEEREAAPFDEEAVRRHIAFQKAPLRQWPIKLALLAPHAPFLKDAELVLAADCAAFARTAFHAELLRGRPLAIGCPKLDDHGLALDRLTAIIRTAGLRGIRVLRMEVPCCGGLEMLARVAAQRSGVDLPITSAIVVIGPAFARHPGAAGPPPGGCPSVPRRTI